MDMKFYIVILVLNKIYWCHDDKYI